MKVALGSAEELGSLEESLRRALGEAAAAAAQGSSEGDYHRHKGSTAEVLASRLQQVAAAVLAKIRRNVLVDGKEPREEGGDGREENVEDRVESAQPLQDEEELTTRKLSKIATCGADAKCQKLQEEVKRLSATVANHRAAVPLMLKNKLQEHLTAARMDLDNNSEVESPPTRDYQQDSSSAVAIDLQSPSPGLAQRYTSASNEIPVLRERLSAAVNKMERVVTAIVEAEGQAASSEE